MTVARKHIVNPKFTRYYHCTGRCVRRAFLCGQDKYSGRNYEHRRQWIISRIAFLSKLFAIEIVGYSIMANHYHLVVRLNPEEGEQWSDEQVLTRWEELYGIPDWFLEAKPGDSHMDAVKATWIRKRRGYLTDLSWFMRCINEFIARKANREDNCTGSFWQGRIHSQALLDEKALIACLAYVDLNPIRAKLAKTPEDSDFTSIQQRIQKTAKQCFLKDRPELVPFRQVVSSAEERKKGLPLTEVAYLQLVDVTGRTLAKGKDGGTIPADALPILERLGFNEKAWMNAAKLFGIKRYRVIGPVDDMRVMATELREKSRAWYNGYYEVERALKPPI